MNSHTRGKTKPRSGGAAKGRTPPPKNKDRGAGPAYAINAKIVDQARKPISGAKYEIADEKGVVKASGTTDWQGTVYHEIMEPGRYELKVVALPPAAPEE